MPRDREQCDPGLVSICVTSWFTANHRSAELVNALLVQILPALVRCWITAIPGSAVAELGDGMDLPGGGPDFSFGEIPVLIIK